MQSQNHFPQVLKDVICAPIFAPTSITTSPSLQICSNIFFASKWENSPYFSIDLPIYIYHFFII